MQYNSDIKQVLITKQEIQQRIQQLGKEISEHYKDKFPLMIGILKGSWIFFADLIRAIDVDCQVEFMSVSSYNGGTSSTGTITIVKDLSVPIDGRDVIIVEDIIDTGLTISHLVPLLMSRNANSVTVATLLSKPSRREIEVDAKYIGFEIPDKFVIGYGLDFAQKYRGLPDICVLDEKAYQ